PAIAAIESATFQALVPVMAAGANFGANIGPAQGQNQNLNLNQNQNQNQSSDQKSAASSDPKSAASNAPSTNSGSVGSGQAGPETKDLGNTPITNTAPGTVTLTTDQTSPQITNSAVTNPTTATATPAAPHITPTGTTTDVADTQTFNLFSHVSIANAGTPTGYI